MAIDRKTGKTIWERVAREQEPHEQSHVDNGTWASSSPITDGERVYAYFESFGLYAYDMNGKLIWEKDLGDKRMRNEFGEGSTPALHGNTLVIVWDHLGGQSFIVALDKRDGKELWRVPRKEIDTWATPLVLDVNGRPQVVVPAMERVRSYDLATGDVVWESDGLTMNAIPSPIYSDGLLFLMSGFRGNDLKAIRVADAKGNIDGTSAIVWTLDRDTPYVPSPVLVDGILYFLKTNSGILTAVDAKTGTPHYQNQRLNDVPECLCVAGVGPGSHLLPRTRGDDARHQVGTDVRGSGEEHARRRVRCVAGARRQRNLSARLQIPLCHRPTVKPGSHCVLPGAIVLVGAIGTSPRAQTAGRERPMRRRSRVTSRRSSTPIAWNAIVPARSRRCRSSPTPRSDRGQGDRSGRWRTA